MQFKGMIKSSERGCRVLFTTVQRVQSVIMDAVGGGMGLFLSSFCLALAALASRKR